MKKIILIACLTVLGMGSSFEAKSQVHLMNPIIDAMTYWFTGCVNGGEGSGGCSISFGIGTGGSVLGSGGNATVQVTHSVSNCKDGYYACCNLLGATCVEEE